MEEIIIVLQFVSLIMLVFLINANTKKFSINNKKRKIFVDTSVLMDGRIIPVAGSGFIDGTLIVPKCVVSELQLMADNSDTQKRSKARFGLDAISELQSMDEVSVEIFQDNGCVSSEVDDRLVELAKKYGGLICTIDYNLNKVAKVEGISVLNINDLAMNLRSAYLPGEKTFIVLTQKGNESKQAVGHLDDGTMVVVENSVDQIGKKVEVEFIRSLQTPAGRMMFAKLTATTKRQDDQRPRKDFTSSNRDAKSKSNNNQRGNKSRINRNKQEARFVDLANR